MGGLLPDRRDKTKKKTVYGIDKTVLKIIDLGKLTE